MAGTNSCAAGFAEHGESCKVVVMKRLITTLVILLGIVGASRQAEAQDRAGGQDEMATIAVIGTGRVGGALGPRIASLGHRVIYGTRAPERDDVVDLVAISGDNAAAMAVAAAAAAADWIVVATPHSAMEKVAAEIGDAAGKIIIDVTNALVPAGGGLMKLDDRGSAGEAWQAAKPGARVVKAFSTVGYHIMADPTLAGGPVTTMLIGDDDKAKQVVARLAADLGFESIDLGPMRNAPYLEGVAVLYLVPLLTGRRDEAFEFYLRKGIGTDPGIKVRVPE